MFLRDMILIRHAGEECLNLTSDGLGTSESACITMIHNKSDLPAFTCSLHMVYKKMQPEALMDTEEEALHVGNNSPGGNPLFA
jgi:hypothetical protein